MYAVLRLNDTSVWTTAQRVNGCYETLLLKQVWGFMVLLPLLLEKLKFNLVSFRLKRNSIKTRNCFIAVLGILLCRISGKLY